MITKFDKAKDIVVILKAEDGIGYSEIFIRTDEFHYCDIKEKYTFYDDANKVAEIQTKIAAWFINSP